MATDLAGQMQAQILMGQLGQRGNDPRAALAARLMAQATDGAPVYSRGAALAKALTGGIAGWMGGQAEQDGKQRQADAIRQAGEIDQSRRAGWARELAALDNPSQPQDPAFIGPPQPAAPLNLQQRMEAAQTLASGGNPLAEGQVRALTFQANQEERKIDNDLAERRFQQQLAVQRQQIAAQNAASGRAAAAARDGRLPPGYRFNAKGEAERIPGVDDEADNITPGRALPILGRLAPKIEDGTATPAELRTWENAVAAAQQQRSYLDQQTGQMVTVRPDLPGYVQRAMRGPQPAVVPPPGAEAPAAMPDAARTPAAPAAGNVLGASAAPAAAMPGAPGVTVAQVAPARPTAAPAGFEADPASPGRMRPIPGGPQDPVNATLTEAQGRSNMFGGLMQEGHKTIGKLDAPSAAAIIAWRNAPEGAVNLGLSENDQRYFNALRVFAAGILRKETGAAFGANELADVQSRFFPLPGDSAGTIQQKARNREQAIRAMQAELPGGQFRGVDIPGSGLSADPPPNGRPPLSSFGR